MYNSSNSQQKGTAMKVTLITWILFALTFLTWQIDYGPLNFLWLVMLVIDFWALVAYVGYEMIIGLVKAIKQ